MKHITILIVLALLLLSSFCASAVNAKLLNDDSISTSQHIQKGRYFSTFITITNPYDAPITGNLSLITPTYFEIQDSDTKPITLSPNSSQTYTFIARPILIRDNSHIDFLKSFAFGASPGNNNLHFNLNYKYNEIDLSETQPFEIKVVASYLSLLLAAINGGLLGSFLKLLTMKRDLSFIKNRNISTFRPLVWGFVGAILAILVQPFGKIYTFEGAMLLGATIGYLGSSVAEDLLDK